MKQMLDEENLSDQGEDNTFANKYFHSIDERFVLNATSMLDQTKTSIREDFAARQINLDLHTFLSKESKGYAI